MNVSSAKRPARAAIVIVAALVAMCLVSCDSGAERNDTKSSCSPDKELAAGTATVTIDVRGVERRFLLHVPTGYEGAKPTPAVFLFHGLGGSNSAIMAISQMAEEADRRGFLLIAPQGRGSTPGWDYQTPASKKGSDLAFVHTLVKDVRKRACVDGDRTYMAGFSNGSFLTLAVACSKSRDFAAFGGIGASFSAEHCAGAPARPIIYFHGTGDRIVPFAGASTSFGRFPPVALALRSWATHNACDAKQAVSEVSSAVKKHDWGGCAKGSDLQAYIIEGGGHRWPGGTDVPSGQNIGAMTQDIDATELMWQFFVKHPRSGQ